MALLGSYSESGTVAAHEPHLSSVCPSAITGGSQVDLCPIDSYHDPMEIGEMPGEE